MSICSLDQTKTTRMPLRSFSNALERKVFQKVKNIVILNTKETLGMISRKDLNAMITTTSNPRKCAMTNKTFTTGLTQNFRIATRLRDTP